MPIIDSAARFLGRRSKAFLSVSATALVLVIGAGDYLTGYELSFGLFYLAPISLVAWYVSRTAGVIAAIICALTWYSVNSTIAPSQVLRVTLIWNTTIRFGFFIVTSTLLSALRRAYELQKEMAQTDPLTGLLNSRAFKDLARIELNRASRSKYEVAALYMDLDNFKDLNDSMGHAAGDQLLIAIGHALRQNLRSTDIVGRLGGDEFSVILSSTSRRHIEATASRLQKAIAAVSASHQCGVTATIGVATYDGLEDIEELIRRADQAMYAAKATSKGSILNSVVRGNA